MSDPIADLLLELYATYKATVFSNLFVGIVFGELTLAHLTTRYPDLRCFIPHTPLAQARMSSFMAHLSISFCKKSSAPFPNAARTDGRCSLSPSLLNFGRFSAEGAMVACQNPLRGSSCSPLRPRCSRWVLSLSCYRHHLAISNSRSCLTHPVPHCGRPTAPASLRLSSQPSLVSS